ncbi:RecB family exonuclease [Trueperella sp. LYQ143]|uniref:RecB family exonuclease n=1 Tax=unclassified Trueperella TaxID=2630174 RepID=UPI003982E7F9
MSSHAAISPSRASDFRTCPLKFRLRSIDRITEKPTPEMLRGTLVHSVLEHIFDACPEQRTEDHAQSLLLPRWQAHQQRHPKDAEIFSSQADIDSWIESARPLISRYFTLEQPQYLQPHARESFVNAVLPSGLAIRGIIDRLDIAPNGAIRVIDYKTGRSPRPEYQRSAIFQMCFYAAALVFSGKDLPARTQLLYLGDGRTLTYDPHSDDVKAIESEINTLWAQIRARLDNGHFEARRNPLCQWCDFQAICPEFGGQPPQMSEQGAAYLLTAEISTSSAQHNAHGDSSAHQLM